MQLTRHTDHALQVLMYLALEPERLATISDIATAYNISRNHLVKVVHELGGHGFIKTFRGKGGGIQLARDASNIVVGDVIRRMEGNMEIVNCIEPRCPILPCCLLKGVLHEARDAFLATLDGYTVQDLLRQRHQRLSGLLRVK